MTKPLSHLCSPYLSQEQYHAVIQDGVLLEAGAGSGKTFVIVEHVLKKISDFVEQSLTLTDFMKTMDRFFIVTFTVNATSEMEKRIHFRLKQFIEEHQQLGTKEYEYFKKIYDNPFLLQVDTIHGLCLRFLKNEFRYDFPYSLKLGPQGLEKMVIGKLLDQWYQIEKNKKNIDLLMNKGVYFSRKFLMNLMEQLLTESHLRYFWFEHFRDQKKTNKLDSVGKMISHWVENWAPIRCLESLLSYESIQILMKEDKTNLSVFLKKIDNMSHLGTGKYRIWLQTMVDIDRVPTFPKNLKEADEYDLWNEVHGGIKFLRKYKNEISFFLQYPVDLEEMYGDIHRLLEDLYAYFMHKMKTLGKMNFADLEIQVYLRLLKEKKSYADYLIIDEFQDVSLIQFEIIKKMIDDKFACIFAVGDPKQSIYRFRGSDHTVFQQAKNYFPHSLQLKDNYRSDQSLVLWNNDFFYFMENQLVQQQKKIKAHHQLPDSTFHVFQTTMKTYSAGNASIDVLRSMKNQENIKGREGLLQLEFMLMMDHLTLLENQHFQTVAFLFPKMTHLDLLIAKMKIHHPQFSFQMKVLRSDTFLYHLLCLSLETILDRSLDEEQRIDHLCSFLKEVGVFTEEDQHEFLRKKVHYFLRYFFIFGLSLSYKNLLINLSLSLSYDEDFFPYLEELEKQFLKLEDLYTSYKDWGEQFLTYKVHHGVTSFSDKRSIEILSIHRSKGMEFDAVFLCDMGAPDLYTEKETLKNPYLALDIPFVGTKTDKQNESLKTMPYIVHDYNEEMHHTFEKMRLYYVASTRAKKRLIFIWPEEVKKSESLWNFCLRNFLSENQNHGDLLNFYYYHPERKIFSPHQENLDLKQEKIHTIDHSDGVTREIALVKDLAVTHLESLLDCPRKFYLTQILNLQPLDSQNILIKEESEAIDTVKKNKLSKKNRDLIHDYLKKQFAHGYILKECKFSVHQMLITGTPHFYMIPSEEGVGEIWQFLDEKGSTFDHRYGLLHFYFYAYGLINLYQQTRFSGFHFRLFTMENDLSLSLDVSVNDINSYVKKVIHQLSQLDQVNLRHCGDCQMNEICRPKSLLAGL
jgi:ATP-dependent helicase/nuclease subunit A